ncbi:diguanylate cyclase [Kurthia sp. 3B1D]|uniref:Diguanylate cyclase n=1 Tax=Candidatus Kurthia intestinigallinarum TaxID=1562256 RepID=A0A433RUB7_9BACL|nr:MULTISPECIES: bifunctional diguanylate cyclase/phosphodiesterase [unclassified Kurthia]RUS55750.1 diguanylate cyclase [Kurthia sp. 3B1D]
MNEVENIFQYANPILNHIHSPMMTLDHEGNIISWNTYCENVFGYSTDEVLGKFPPIFNDEQDKVEEQFTTILRSHKELTLNNFTLLTKDSEMLQMSLFAKALTIRDERIIMVRFLNAFSSEESAVAELSCLRSGLEESFMVLSLDHEGLINFANPLYLKYSKWTPKRILGKTLWQMFPQTDVGTEQVNEIWNVIHSGKIWQGEVEKMTKDGTSYWVELIAIPVTTSGKTPDYYLVLAKDITEKKLLQQRLEKIAYVDQETGLMNRYRLEQIVNEMIDQKQHFTFVYLSIDKFYSLKELYNEEMESILLQEFTNRMKMYFQDSVMARITINDFAVLTPLGEWFIQGFLAYLKQHPIYIDGMALPLTICGGISKYPEDQQTFNHLLKASHAIIDKIHTEGGSTIASLSNDDHKALSKRAMIEKRLMIALDQKDLKVLYQPQLNLESNKIEAVEALVRWEDSELGIIPPDVLIPIAEETGLINDIGTFMLEKSCEQAVAWKNSGHTIRVSINSSVREFRDKNMVKLIREVLERTNCPASLLQIEITEKFALEAEAESSIITQMKQLQADGIRFVLDDFGTGYASFRYMQLLPLEEFKIDQTFISTLTYQKKTQKLIHGMIQFGHSLNMRVVAEGVENKEQLELLSEYGCNAAQGYHIGRPSEVATIEPLF